jgi:hypothetical protein
MLQAARERSGAISPCSKELMKMPSGRRQQPFKVSLAHRQRQVAQIIAKRGLQIERDAVLTGGKKGLHM